MNLVQLAEQAKNLSNQQLQTMLQQPDGQMPPFILAAEAARRQDIERSAQAQPAEPSTVLDDLIKGRTEAAGVNALAGQMAQGMPADQAPAMPEMPEQQMAGGGSVRRFAMGSPGGISDLSAPAPDFGDPMGTGNEYITNPGTPPGDPMYQWLEPLIPDMPPLVPTWEGNKQEAQNKTLSPEDDRENRISRGQRLVTESQQRAAAKEAESANKRGEMGEPDGASTSDADSEAAARRARLEEILKVEKQQRLLGISSSGYAQAAAALLNNEPGLSKGERWANMAAALAEDREGYDEKQATAKKAGAMALLQWDEDARKEAEAKAAGGRDNMAKGYDQRAAAAKTRADAIEATIASKIKEYSVFNPETGLFQQTEIPEPVKQEIQKLREEQQGLMETYNAYVQRSSGLYGAEQIAVYDPAQRKVVWR